jgi:dTDP-4-amino-4,6-dideoxygalactose transaminase
MSDKRINVTKPFLPPLDEYQEYLKNIWDNNWVTNNGPYHKQLEKELANYLGVKYVSLFSNGTLALVTALQALNIEGEVITSPYSFVATTHSLWWNKITPVFIDVDSEYGNLNPDLIEAAITKDTTAILPIHVYGQPCELKKIESIAKKNNLKVIYDAAHAFGVKENQKSILNYGNLSVLSFHATKVFNTFEGGAIICHDLETKQHIDDLKNFGFRDETIVVKPGINAKMNEVQAAMGLLQLKYIDEAIKERQRLAKIYTEELQNINGIRLIKTKKEVEWNYSYFPIFITETNKTNRDQLYLALKKEYIYARRYFYPLISSFNPYSKLPSSNNDFLSVANKIANEVICLPIYPGLKNEEISNICNIIKKTI